MNAVTGELAKANVEMSPDTVHDLRVALRRCRSMAEGVATIDPHPAWRRLRRTSRNLFRQLGALRDAHVMISWVEKLAPEGQPVRDRLLDLLDPRVRRLERSARDAVLAFDERGWLELNAVLAERSRSLRLDGLVFRHLALERLAEAHALHRDAIMNGTGAAFHALRIAVKRFRYTVENFLPSRHARWARSLKRTQDLLGEMNDLDLLWRETTTLDPPLPDAEQSRWRGLLAGQLDARLVAYQDSASGKRSIWSMWRDGLPDGAALANAAFARLVAWAAHSDPDPRHSRRVARLSMALFDALGKATDVAPFHDASARRLLRAAALLHDVGRSRRRRNRHKGSFRMIRKLQPPLGWESAELRMVGVIARYHRGAEPRDDHPGFADLSIDERRTVTALAGILRLANALQRADNAGVIEVALTEEPVAFVLRAKDYVETVRSAARIGGMKRLLEGVIGKPIVVMPAG
jgi:CHAD domain-containing protein